MKLSLKVQPGAKKDEWCGEFDGGYRVRITAPPVDGKANAHLIKFLAKHFGLKKSQINLISGETSRNKVIEIADIQELSGIQSK